MNVRALVCLALLHTLVDGYAQLVLPLWPRLTERLQLDPWALGLVWAAWQTAASVSQPLFGWWGDRFGGRWLIGLGPALAVVCLSLLGWAGGAVSLAALLVLGGLGIGAFHPEAAVHVVEAAGPRANHALALFVFGGMVGLGLGPLVSGTLSQRYGLASLAWALPPGLLAVGLLVVLQPPARQQAHGPSGHGLAEALHGRWGAAGLLLLVATLRAVPVLGIPLAAAFWLKQQGVGEEAIGGVQSVFLLSGGLGTLLSPLVFRPGRELAGLIGTTVPAAACMTLLAWPHPAARLAALAGSGLFLQGAIPLLIGYSQRLLPRGRRLAASLTLGTSWGLAGLIVAGLQAAFAGRYDHLLGALLPFALLAGLASFLLPREEALASPTARADACNPVPQPLR